MKKILVLIINDFKNIFRERILTVMFFIPVFFTLLLRFAIPAVAELLPVLKDYYNLLLSMVCIMSAISPAYVISFIMLDEKDEDVLTVMKIMPVAPSVFVIYRTAFIFFLGFIFSILIITLSGLSIMKAYQVIMLSLQVAMIAPTSAMIIITWANNKIEGATYYKGMNFIYALPLISFFISSLWKFAFGLIPVFWIYQSFAASDNFKKFMLFWGIGFFIHLAVFLIVYKIFRRKIF